MVCFVFPPRFSGAAMQALALSKRLVASGVGCEFLVPNFIDNSIYKKTQDETLIIHRVWGADWGFVFVMLLFLILKRRQFHTVHFHGFSRVHFACVFISRLLGLRTVQKLTKGDESHNELNTSGLLAFLRRRAIFSIDHFVPISSALHRALIEFGIPQSRIHFIPNGVEVAAFKCDREADVVPSKVEFSFSQNAFVLLCAGVIDRRKNNLLILQAISCLFEIFPATKNQLKLVFAGPFFNAAYSREVIGYADSAGLNDNVVFLEHVEPEGLARLHCASDLCVFAGSNEGLPNVLLEAKAAGLPIVAFSAYGVDDVVRSGVDGFLVPFGDIGAFAEKVRLLMENVALRKSYSTQSVNDCLDRYAFEKITTRYLTEIYNI
jgi:glycosyltransferase involved in cell wall biosynthesis